MKENGAKLNSKSKFPFPKSLPCYDDDQIFRNWMISISGFHWTLRESHMDLYWVLLVIIAIKLSSSYQKQGYMMKKMISRWYMTNPDMITAHMTKTQDEKILIFIYNRWGLMTLTTVGYDYNPETLLGKILGGCCALSGVMINHLNCHLHYNWRKAQVN